MIKILIADANYLSRKGLELLIEEEEQFLKVGTAETKEGLAEMALLHQPDVIIVDYISLNTEIEELAELQSAIKNTCLLAITPMQPKVTFIKALDRCVTSHLLKDCDKDEIIEAIQYTSRGQQFLCGKVLNNIVEGTEDIKNLPAYTACDGVKVTEREMEIIKLIAEGYANKEIAEKLFLSTHTVTTHRKNIMNKLEVNNTAGIVMYAVRKDLLSPNWYLFSAGN